MEKYKKVCKVFDDQDSDNICFDMSDSGKRYFVKYTGTPMECACVNIEEVLINRKRTIPHYKDFVKKNTKKHRKAGNVLRCFVY